MENCPYCNEFKRVRNGFHHGVQRYKCKECGYQYTVKVNAERSDMTKSLAVTLYLLGLPLKNVASLVKLPKDEQTEVWHWVKKHKFKVRLSDIANFRSSKPAHASKSGFIKQDMKRIMNNQRDTDLLKSKYGVDDSFVHDLAKIVNYMTEEKSKSVKRFVVIEVHRYSGEVKKMMLSP